MPLYANWRLKVMDHNRPEPLPFPPTGGCWSPLVDYLPETNAPAVPLHRYHIHQLPLPVSYSVLCLSQPTYCIFLFFRCNIAVILLTDLIVDHGVKVEWSAYLHLLLHAIFIGSFLSIFIGLFKVFSLATFIQSLLCIPQGFDHHHPEVYEHCKRLLLHLLVVQGANSNVQSVAMVLLRNRDYNDPRVLTVKPVAPELNLTGQFSS